MNNWHWRLLVLLFGIFSRSGFGDDWISQVIAGLLTMKIKMYMWQAYWDRPCNAAGE
jgi:hypothetical protein